jgi:hypothetical protein
MYQEILKFEVFMVLQLPSLVGIDNTHLKLLGADRSVNIKFLGLREVAHVLRDVIFLLFL